MRRIFLLFFLGYQFFLNADDILLSYNKCGTHLFLYSIQYLSSRPIRNIGGPKLAMAFENTLEDNYLKPTLYHTHTSRDITQRRKKEDKLIVLVRNPVELVLRNLGYQAGKYVLTIMANNLTYDATEILPSKAYIAKSLGSSIKEIQHLCNIIQTYHRYPSSKLLLFYEDLLIDPRETMYKSLRFLDESDARLDMYMHDLTTIKKQCLSAYIEQFGWEEKWTKIYITVSDRKDPMYYQKKYSEDQVQEIKLLFKSVLDPSCFKYIKRFYE